MREREAVANFLAFISPCKCLLSSLDAKDVMTSLSVCSLNLSLYSCISTSLLMLHLVTCACLMCCHLSFEKGTARVLTIY